MQKTLPKGWDVQKLGEVTKIRRGASPRPMGNPKYFGGNIPWIRISDIHRNGKFLKRTDDHVTEEGAKKSVYLKSGSLIMAMAASIGTPCFLAVDGCIHDGFVVFEDLSPKLDKEFLYYFIVAFKNQFTNLAPEGTQKNLNTGIIKSVKIPLPPLPTQHKIVEILEEADNLRKLRQQADEKMKDLIPSLFVEMFGDPATNPKGWEVKKLGEVCLGIQNGIGKNKEFYGEGIKVANISDLYASFRFHPVHFSLLKVSKKEIDKYKLNRGDILFVRSSVKKEGVAVCSSFDSEALCLFSSFMIRAIPNIKLIHPYFLSCCLRTEQMRAMLINASNTVAITNISQPAIKRIKIPLPPLPLQQEFAERVEEIEAEKARQTESKKKLDELFNSLMQRAFKGELVA